MLMSDNRFDINALTLPLQALIRRFWRRIWRPTATCLVIGGMVVPAVAAEPEFDTPSKAPVPRWAMLRRNEVYARNGPSKDNPKVWTYRVATLPVQIISETRDWRLVCDPDGGVAWVSKTMLQAPRTVLSPAQRIDLRTRPDAGADIRAIVRPRVLAQLDKCKNDWCRISVDGQTGWAPRSQLWGTQTTPVCARPDPLAAK